MTRWISRRSLVRLPVAVALLFLGRLAVAAQEARGDIVVLRDADRGPQDALQLTTPVGSMAVRARDVPQGVMALVPENDKWVFEEQPFVCDEMCVALAMPSDRGRWLVRVESYFGVSFALISWDADKERVRYVKQWFGTWENYTPSSAPGWTRAKEWPPVRNLGPKPPSQLTQHQAIDLTQERRAHKGEPDLLVDESADVERGPAQLRGPKAPMRAREAPVRGKSRATARQRNACDQLVSWHCDLPPGTPAYIRQTSEKTRKWNCELWRDRARDVVAGPSAFVRQGTLDQCARELRATQDMNTFFE